MGASDDTEGTDGTRDPGRWGALDTDGLDTWKEPGGWPARVVAKIRGRDSGRKLAAQGSPMVHRVFFPFLPCPSVPPVYAAHALPTCIPAHQEYCSPTRMFSAFGCQRDIGQERWNVAVLCHEGDERR